MTKAIVTDIEGTTSSIDFVKEVLFPFARKRLPAFIETHIDNPDVRRWLDEAAGEADLHAADKGQLIEVLLAWADSDRKSTSLKALQGMIWKEGYESGAYQAHLYPEVAGCLRRWHADGLDLYIYSSGSVPAQELFFRYSNAGDLTPLLNGYFDTETGPKREAESYRRIAESIGMQPAEILFLSDTREELDAAAEAGLDTVQLCRPPQQCPDGAAHKCVSDFDAIRLKSV